MAQVKILVKGYYKVKDRKEHVSPTMTLVRDKGINMVVDPGSIKDKKILINALKKEGLIPEKINFVCITHSHPDHYLNLGMLPNAKVLDYWGVWEKDTVHDWKERFSEDIEIIRTPGHSYDCITLFVKTKKGIVAVAGDVFITENPPKEDPFASDSKTLKKSKKLVLKKANFIIPGHGDIFEVKKK